MKQDIIGFDKRTLNSYQRRKVHLFIEAARTWYSGYSMGEVVDIVVIDGDGNKSTFIIYDRRQYYRRTKYTNYIPNHGSLSLVLDQTGFRTKYTVVERSKRGKLHFDWYCDIQRKSELRHKQLNMRNFFYFYNNFFYDTLSFHGLPNSGQKRVHYNNVTTYDYWENTTVVFEVVIKQEKNGPAQDFDEVKDVLALWKTMMADPRFKYHHSPCENSISAYLVDHNTGEIYRYSDHWGAGIRNCNWYLKDCPERNILAIGVANVSDFKKNIPDRHIRIFSDFERDQIQSSIFKDIERLESLKSQYNCDSFVLARIDKDISVLRKTWDEVMSSQKEWETLGETYWVEREVRYIAPL